MGSPTWSAQGPGVELDTLFVDEGFGGLDPDTVDQMVAVIDELRDRGRAVGIISHMSERKDWISERIGVAAARRVVGPAFRRLITASVSG